MAISSSSAPEITILNSMAGREFEAALDRHVAWGLRWLDLKDGIFGKSIVDLSDVELAAASRMISERGLRVYALSTSLFAENIEAGKAVFLQKHLGSVSRVLEIARELAPIVVRLIAPMTAERRRVFDAVQHVKSEASWLFDLYDEAIARIAGAGFTTVIENESPQSILGRPQEVIAFFAALHNRRHAMFTWDVVNMWQAGTFPTLEVYEALRPVIGYLHLKGGQSDEASPLSLRWKSPLDEASWPVREIVEQVVQDGTCSMICLNPPHGELRPGTDARGWVERDIQYLKRLLGNSIERVD